MTAKPHDQRNPELTAAEQWRFDGSVKTLGRLLKIKFGETSAAYQPRLESATPAQLERYTTRFVSAQSIGDVFADPQLINDICRQLTSEFEREGTVETLQQLLTIKFGEIPSEYQRRLESATPAQLERYTTQFVSAQTLAEVFAEPT